jgi:hypothetical protein
MHLTSFKALASALNRLQNDTNGQDLVEYAMLTGFMVIAIWALFPTEIVPSISSIFARLLNIASTLVP